jgi:hypothetical protein
MDVFPGNTDEVGASAMVRRVPDRCEGMKRRSFQHENGASGEARHADDRCQEIQRESLWEQLEQEEQKGYDAEQPEQEQEQKQQQQQQRHKLQVSTSSHSKAKFVKAGAERKAEQSNEERADEEAALHMHKAAEEVYKHEGVEVKKEEGEGEEEEEEKERLRTPPLPPVPPPPNLMTSMINADRFDQHEEEFMLPIPPPPRHQHPGHHRSNNSF